MRRRWVVAAVVAAVGCGGAPPRPAPDANAVATGSTTASSNPTATASTTTTPTSTSTSTPTATATSTSTSTPGTGTGTGTEDGGGGAAKAKPTRIGARHVLVQYMGAQHAESSVVRTRDQALSVAQEVLRRAKAGEDFARLVVEFSDEPGAAARGGSLGRFGHGQMVQAFEDAAFALAPGEISGIVESPFGYHIIQRTE